VDWAPDYAKWAALVISAAREMVSRTAVACASFTFAMAVKMACISSNLLIQVSPWPEARGWAKKGTTGMADAAPYVSIALSGWQWCFYGTFAFLITNESSFFVLVQSNILGAVFGSYYVMVFLRNCKDLSAKETLYSYLSAVGSLALLQVCAVAMLPVERALFLSGLVGSFCCFLSATSLLVTLPTVIQTQDSSSIPGLLVGVGLFSAVAWCTCGRLLDDPMVTFPNLYAACACSAALGLKLRYAGPANKLDMPAKDSEPAEDEYALLIPFEKEARFIALQTKLEEKKLPKWYSKEYDINPVSEDCGMSPVKEGLEPPFAKGKVDSPSKGLPGGRSEDLSEFCSSTGGTD